MSAAKFFNDNLLRLDPKADPLSWNLNAGLQALAKQLDEIQTEQNRQKRELSGLDMLVRRIPTR